MGHTDADYAAAFAQLHDADLWMLTLDVAVGDVLDLTRSTSRSHHSDQSSRLL